MSKCVNQQLAKNVIEITLNIGCSHEHFGMRA